MGDKLELLKRAREYVADALESYEHSDGRDLLIEIDAALSPSPPDLSGDREGKEDVPGLARMIITSIEAHENWADCGDLITARAHAWVLANDFGPPEAIAPLMWKGRFTVYDPEPEGESVASFWALRRTSTGYVEPTLYKREEAARAAVANLRMHEAFPLFTRPAPRISADDELAELADTLALCTNARNARGDMLLGEQRLARLVAILRGGA